LKRDILQELTIYWLRDRLLTILRFEQTILHVSTIFYFNVPGETPNLSISKTRAMMGAFSFSSLISMSTSGILLALQ
jgi:hypothetical protein